MASAKTGLMPHLVPFRRLDRDNARRGGRRGGGAGRGAAARMWVATLSQVQGHKQGRGRSIVHRWRCAIQIRSLKICERGAGAARAGGWIRIFGATRDTDCTLAPSVAAASVLATQAQTTSRLLT